MTRKIYTFLFLLLTMSIILSACGHSPYYIQEPKGYPHSDVLDDDQLEFVDNCIVIVTRWYNSIDPSKPQNFKSFIDENTSSWIGTLHIRIQKYTDDPKEKAELQIVSDAFDRADYLMDLVCDIDPEYIEISEKDWQEIHDSLIYVINYFYN